MRYDKGRKEESRRRIMNAASERFRSEGIAASGLAGIMNDAGLTNGAFYPHFKSKAELVRDSVAEVMDDQSRTMRDLASEGGLEAAISAYLSPDHRDNAAAGCTLAALLPELAREPIESRRVWAERLLATVRQFESGLPQTRDAEAKAIGIYATLIGALQLARIVKGTPLSDKILAAGSDAALALGGLKQVAADE